MGKRFLATIVALCTFIVAFADEQVTFETSAPMIVSAGEAFRVEFNLNAKPDDKSFEAPSFDGFSVLAGPSVSQGSSIQIVNGSMTRSVSYTITYVLQAPKAGQLTIGVAKIAVDGKSYSTQKTPIEVRQDNDNHGSTASQSNQRQEQQSLEQRASNQLAEDDLMLRLSVSRKSVYKGEAVRATLKLYSRVNVIGSEGAKLPSFDGFWSQQLESEQGPFRETLNGKVYDAYNLGEYILYPQQSGKLTIEPAKITIVAQVFVRSNRQRNSFFDGPDIYNLRREVKSPAVTIDVKSFPAGAPASFTGAVGKYTMEAHLSSGQVSANSAANIDLKISGTGNIGFVKEPQIVLPVSFELYDVKSTEQVKTTASGSVGYRQFEYPFIARAEGDYTIAPIEFTYFSPDSGEYVTLTTDSFDLSVTPDKNAPASGTGVSPIVSKQDVRLLGNDIRFIKLSEAKLYSASAPLVLSPLYFAIMAAMVLLAVVLYFIIGKRIRDSHNSVLVKGKRANKIAVQRFRAAERYMREMNRHAFYEEMLKAMWGYISDRFNIPIADLTKESMRDELTRRGAADEAKQLIAIISLCEEAQYSPVEPATMSDLYGRGIDIVSKIESLVKR